MDNFGRKAQRAEIRFDDIAGRLRTLTGGPSRQTIVDGKTVRSRLVSPRETARLMGLPEDYDPPPQVPSLGSAHIEPLLAPPGAPAQAGSVNVSPRVSGPSSWAGLVPVAIALADATGGVFRARFMAFGWRGAFCPREVDAASADFQLICRF